MHEVKKARYLEDYKILIEFTNKETKIVDFREALNNFTGQIFKPLKKIEYFKSFRISEGIATIEWDNGADVAPEFLYDIGQDIKLTSKKKKSSLKV